MDKLSSAVDFRPRSRQLYMGDMPLATAHNR